MPGPSTCLHTGDEPSPLFFSRELADSRNQLFLFANLFWDFHLAFGDASRSMCVNEVTRWFLWFDDQGYTFANI
jgi:cytosine/adenosine deaminase-related metal-dependent hydrolase